MSKRMGATPPNRRPHPPPRPKLQTKPSIDLDLAQRIVYLLSDLIEMDEEAISRLAQYRVPCNKAMADHPTVQVGETEEGDYEVGLLGILNGLAGVLDDGWGAIGVVFDDSGKAVGAKLLTTEDRQMKTLE